VLAQLSKLAFEPRIRALFDRWAIWAIVALAAVLRFFDLGYPKKLVFDETYYVKDALSLTQGGFERNWPEGTDDLLASGQVPTMLETGSFVVHPPLGKWIIGAGMWLFGPGNSFGWRFSVALLGTLAVLLIMLVARKLFKSTVWAALAGFFFAIDGVAVVLARTALLDTILMFFVLLAFWFLLLDRERNFGQVFNRPWMLASGAALGAATAVKWNGIFFLAFFGIYVVLTEVLGAKEFSILKFLKTAATKFLILVPIAFATYLASWTGWLTTSGGYDRGFADDAANRFTGLLSWVPISLQSLWQYHVDAYNFHVGLRTTHSYASNPLTWLFMGRPTSFFYEGAAQGEGSCTAVGGCSSAITALGNPVIWWAAIAAMVFLIWLFVRRSDKTAGLILLGVAAGYLPWMLYLERTVFHFYVIVFEPFVILALVYALATLWRSVGPAARSRLLGAYAGYALASAAFSLFFLPIWLGTWTPYWFWFIHMWIPSWI
jgi:dolichyl-phosphate-mannose--protein O-mannosyl transferase